VSVPSMADIEKSLFFMKQYAERQNNPSKDWRGWPCWMLASGLRKTFIAKAVSTIKIRLVKS
jgi:hypothetical protein